MDRGQRGPVSEGTLVAVEENHWAIDVRCGLGYELRRRQKRWKSIGMEQVRSWWPATVKVYLGRQAREGRRGGKVKFGSVKGGVSKHKCTR